MVLLLFVFVIILVFCPCSVEDKRLNVIVFTIIFLFLILIAGLRNGQDPDYETYLEFYNSIRDLNEKIQIEPTYVFLSLISPHIIFLFLLYSVIGVSVRIIAIKRLTSLFALSLLMYLSFFYSLHEMIQVRAGVASSFFLMSLLPLYDRNWKKFLLFGFTAVLFHYSALILFPLWFLNAKRLNNTIWIFLIPFVYILFFLGITFNNFLSLFGAITNVDTKLLTYLYEAQNKSEVYVNVLNIPHVFRCCLAMFIVFYIDKLVQHNKFTIILVKIYIVGLVSYIYFSPVPVIAFRISEFYSVVEIVLIPLIIYAFKGQYLQRIIGVSLCLIFLFFSYYLNILML